MKILHFILKILAKLVLRKYHPQVIAITGSVGKTSTKEAVYSVLVNKFRVEKSIKNYNNEIGLPLTIFNKESGHKNIFKWLAIFLFVLKILIFRKKDYPKVLILEMAADQPGDINYLTSFAKPDRAIITTIGHSHLESFGSLQNIIKEKGSILNRLTKDDYAILNEDDKEVLKFKGRTKAKVRTFGQSKEADIYISHIKISTKDNIIGMSFKLNNKGSEIPIFLPNVLGWQHAQATAAATAVGLSLGMNLVEIGKSLRNYQPAPGRTNLIKGIKHTYLIDDTYNSAPQSSFLALEILKDFPREGRRIAVLGDMLELGKLTEEGHRSVGKRVKELNIDYLFTIGERTRDIAKGAQEAGFSKDKIFSFPFNKETGLFLQERLKENDIVLIKGSRGMKMEEIVYEIMAEPWKANELLVSKVK